LAEAKVHSHPWRCVMRRNDIDLPNSPAQIRSWSAFRKFATRQAIMGRLTRRCTRRAARMDRDWKYRLRRAARGWAPKPLVRQAKLGASCRVGVPAEKGLTIHSYRVLQLRRWKPNKSVEAYTGKHAGRRRDRTLQSLIQPRYGVLMQMATVLTVSEANTDGSIWWDPRGSAGVHFRAWHACKEAFKNLGDPAGSRLKPEWETTHRMACG